MNPTIEGNSTPNVTYRTHVQTYGWQGWKFNGSMSGTSGQAKRLEGIEIKLTNKPKFELDVWYVNHCSFLLDLKIIFMTIKKVFVREGISSETSVTMEAFTGNN